MNVLWSKGKFHKIFSTDNVNLHASGDGAAAGRCCRLCGGDTSLRALGDSYVWEGVEERYDQLLYDCFGVRVQVSQTDCLICEWCVRQLRSTERFKALVHAAFDKPTSSSTHTITSSTKTPKRQKSDEEKSIDNKNIIELLKSKMVPDKKKRRPYERKSTLNSSVEGRRTNIQCRVCKQKYPMIVPCSGGKDFVCSRCKKDQSDNGVCKKCYVMMPSALLRNHVCRPAKTDFRGKNRQPSLTKNPSQIKSQPEGPTRNRNVAKYRCVICPKKYAAADLLVEHIKCQHGKHICPFCKKQLSTKETLERHIQMHKDHSSLNYYLSGPAKFAKTKRDVKNRVIAREKRSI